MQKNIPAVSIIIPLYNAEKYIGECLESILAQTFTDYEVIVVDDCSTDKSVEVVKSYFEKFSGKLRLILTAKNSGNPGPPSNIGINFSTGAYIFFMDNDDAITETALEEMFLLAKKFDADVVHCKRYYRFPADKKYSDKTARVLHKYLIGEEETPPAFVNENILERIKILNEGKLFLNLWTKLIRREIIFQNELKLINGMAQDMVFTCCLFLCAKKYLLVPNAVNLYRVDPNSLSHSSKTLQVHVHQWATGLVQGFNYFEKFFGKQIFLSQRPDAKFSLTEIWIRECCKYLKNFYLQYPAWQLNELIRKEFDAVENKSALMAFLFSRMNLFNLKADLQEKNLKELQQKISAPTT